VETNDFIFTKILQRDSIFLSSKGKGYLSFLPLGEVVSVTEENEIIRNVKTKQKNIYIEDFQNKKIDIFYETMRYVKKLCIPRGRYFCFNCLNIYEKIDSNGNCIICGATIKI
jgi:rubrerythrin